MRHRCGNPKVVDITQAINQLAELRDFAGLRVEPFVGCKK